MASLVWTTAPSLAKARRRSAALKFWKSSRRVVNGWQSGRSLTHSFFLQAAGLAQVEAARNDGRWATAYAGSATMVIPEDFLAALQQDPAAHAFYATLKRASQFTIYHRLHSAKRPETRQRWMAELLTKLARGESP